jgi:hypothetical protein
MLFKVHQNKYGEPLQWFGLCPSQGEGFLGPKVILEAFYPFLPEDEYPALLLEMFQE